MHDFTQTPRCECLTRLGERCAIPGSWDYDLPEGRRVRICSTHKRLVNRGTETGFIPAPSSGPATAPAVPVQEAN
ncbi:MAG: hypothetical protein PHT19_11160 [Methylococcus sp.]|nr:hypothetical protein [Methylococcus sp.]